MTNKEWLSRAYKLDKEIDTLNAERDKAYWRATSVTSNLVPDKVQTSQHNSSEDNSIAYANYSAELNAMIDNLIGIKQEILDAVNNVDDSVLRTLLIKRYICFEKWEQIAVDMDYSYYHVVKDLHKKALKELKTPLNPTL